MVSYLPDPLGRFLDALRKELIPGCVPHAHVTLLPPRPLTGDLQFARDYARSIVPDFAPFEVTLEGVEMFPSSNVVYIALGRGEEELKALYRRLATGPLAAEERFPYHPHVTLAQEIAAGHEDEIRNRAAALWSAWDRPRRFTVETLHFVRNSLQCGWLDLDSMTLGSLAETR